MAFCPAGASPTGPNANRQARAWCDRVNARPKRRLKATPRNSSPADDPGLRRLPRWIPEPCLLHHGLVDVEGYVTLHTNHESVPSAFIGRRLEVRESQDRVVIYEGPEIIADAREVDPLSRNCSGRSIGPHAARAGAARS